jgi:diguanylate cyclase (GGDEF)-like protein
VLLPETSIAGAVQIADQIRDRLAALREDHGAGDNAKISIGIACLVPSSSTAYTALLAAADDALYRAKELGRDRIELSDTSLTQPAGKLLEPQDRAA